jgi:hypothetical protein
MNGWESYLIAEVGASAALTGLIFVSVSINLKRILSFPKLPNRALGALLMFTTVLIVSSLLLVPGQSLTAGGIEMAAIGLAVWITITLLDASYWRNTKRKYRRTIIPLAIVNQLSLLSYIVGGVLLFFGNSSGMFLTIPAFLLSIVKGLVDSWVLLVEINR